MQAGASLQLNNWLRFKHLVLLATLADSRNMHVTARQMYLSQPAASKMLKDLESFFGFKIFERQPRAMVVTELGAHVVRHAHILLNDADRLVDEIGALRQGGYGQLIIGAIPAAAPEILPVAIAELKCRRPRLAISFQEQSSDRLLIDLEYKRLDLVIGRLTNSDQHNLFDFEPLREEPLRIVVRSGHPLIASQPNLEELSHWPWVLHPATSPLRGVFEAALAEAGIASPTSVIETTSTQAALQLLKVSDMLAVLPRSILRSPVAAGQYQTLPLIVGEPLDYYGIITRKGEALSSAGNELVLALRSQGRVEQDTAWR